MKMPKRGEKGFTLIELLIVVAILGVLAAIVIPNVGQFIGRGEAEAKDTEFQTIQSSVHSMMIDNDIDTLASVATEGVDEQHDMRYFPCTDGSYVLYHHDKDGTYVNYLATGNTTYDYWCDTMGTIGQSDEPWE